MKRFLSASNFWMFVKFNCVGIINTVIDYLIFFLLASVAGANEYLANLIAYIVAATNSFFCNSLFVYKEKELTAGKYFKFLIGNSTVFLISTGVIWLLSGQFGLHELLSKAISAPVTMVLNFLIQRLVIFKKSADTEQDALDEKIGRIFNKNASAEKADENEKP